MKPGRAALLALASLAWLTGSTFAQEMVGELFPRNLEALLEHVYGRQRSFTARAQIVVAADPHHELGALSALFIYREGKTRSETDLTRVKSPDLSPNDVAALTQMGLAQAVEIYRPDKEVSYLIFPNVRAWCEVPDDQPPPPAPAAKRQPAKLEKTRTGTATIDQHPCVQYQLTITQPDGDKRELTVWEATDLHEFPLQTQFADHGHTVTVHLREIDQNKPDAWLFDPPAGYHHYRSPDDLIENSARPAMPQ